MRNKSCSPAPLRQQNAPPCHHCHLLTTSSSCGAWPRTTAGRAARAQAALGLPLPLHHWRRHRRHHWWRHWRHWGCGCGCRRPTTAPLPECSSRKICMPLLHAARCRKCKPMNHQVPQRRWQILRSLICLTHCSLWTLDPLTHPHRLRLSVTVTVVTGCLFEDCDGLTEARPLKVRVPVICAAPG